MKLSIILCAAALMSVTLLTTHSAVAQGAFDVQAMFRINKLGDVDRAVEVRQDNEFVASTPAVGTFFPNPLTLNRHALNYSKFGIQSSGELELIKAGVTGDTMRIPFYVHLRRKGLIIKQGDVKFLKIDISTILKWAEPGDQLIIEPVNKEDWKAKRILKLLNNGC
jgi:hypothetical protein